MSLASDVHLVIGEHATRLDEHDSEIGAQRAELARHDAEHSEFRGYFAMLDRKEARIMEALDQFKAVVTGQFRDLRAQLARGQNGR